MLTFVGLSALKSTSIQVAVSLLANWGMLNTGMVMAFPSAVVPPLLGSGPGLHASVDEASWIASLSMMIAMFASPVSGQLVDRIGRRKGLILLSLLAAIGWLLMAVISQSLYVLYAGRLLTGVATGMANSITVVYTSEVTTASLRTTMVSFSPILLATGVSLVYTWVLFYQDSWVEVSYFAFGLIMISLVLTPLLPESPLWLLSRGRAEEALQALQRLRGASAPEQVKEELDSFSSRANDKQQTSSWFSTFHKLRQPQAYKPLLMMLAYFLIQQMSGVTLVLVFAVDFARDAGIVVEAYYIALAMSLGRMFGTLLSTWVCSVWGRRLPGILSATSMSASMLGLALAVSPFLTLPVWLVCILSVVFVSSSSIGFAALPLSMNGEIYPTNVRGVCSGLTACMAYFATFVVVKIYPGTVRAVGAFPVFVFFAASGIIGTIFLYVFLPETHGKTLLQIENDYKGTSKQQDHI